MAGFVHFAGGVFPEEFKFHNEILIGLCCILLESLYVIIVRKC